MAISRPIPRLAPATMATFRSRRTVSTLPPSSPVLGARPLRLNGAPRRRRGPRSYTMHQPLHYAPNRRRSRKRQPSASPGGMNLIRRPPPPLSLPALPDPDDPRRSAGTGKRSCLSGQVRLEEVDGAAPRFCGERA